MSQELVRTAVKRFPSGHTAACEFMLPGPIIERLANILCASERSLFLKIPGPRSSRRRHQRTPSFRPPTPSQAPRSSKTTNPRRHRNAGAQRSTRSPPRRAEATSSGTRKTRDARPATAPGPARGLPGLVVSAGWECRSGISAAVWGLSRRGHACAVCGRAVVGTAPAVRCLWEPGPRLCGCCGPRADVKLGVRSVVAPGRGGRGRAPGAPCRLRLTGRRPRVRRGVGGRW